MRYVWCYYFIMVSFCFLLISCSDKSEKTIFQPKIVEVSDSSPMPNHLREVFMNYNYPAGLIPVACYVDSISSAMYTGSYADELFDQFADDYQSTGNFRKCGMLILISESPRLIQIRVGSLYKAYCSMTGVTSGNDYLTLQMKLESEAFSTVLPHFLQNIKVRIDELNELPWYKRMRINDIMGFISTFLDYAGSPSENFYGICILKPILIMMAFFTHMLENIFLSILLVLSLLLVGRYFLVRWLKHLANKNRLFRFLPVIFNFLLGFLFSIPVAGAAILLSGGRMEDMIALHSFNIPYIETIVRNVSDYSVGGSIVTIIFFVLLYMLKMSFGTNIFLYNLYPASIQRSIYEQTNQYLCAITIFSHQADLQKVESSPTPYSEIFYSSLGRIVGGKGLLLVLAALFVLPQIVLYIGIVLALNDLFKTAWQAKIILNMPGIEAEEREKQKMNLWGPLIGTIVAVAIMLVISLFLNPMPNRKDIEYIPHAERLIDSSVLAGNYTFESILSEENSSYGSAILKQQSEVNFVLLITSQYDPQIYELTYDETEMCFCSEKLGRGEIHYNRDLNSIKITFKIQNVTWILSK